jgi:hypothetical protein
MKMAFGLVSLLVTIGIIALLMSNVSIPIIQAGNETRKDAQQIAGLDPSGVPAHEFFKVSEVRTSGGRFEGIQVTSVDPRGALPKYYGLMVGDVIVGANNMKFEDVGMAEAPAAKNWVLDAYQKQWDLNVIRNGQKITLVAAKIAIPGMGTGAGAGAGAGAGTGSTPGAPANGDGSSSESGAGGGGGGSNPLRDQIDALPRIGI